MEGGALHGCTYGGGAAGWDGTAGEEECSVRNKVLIRWNQSALQGSNYGIDLHTTPWPPIRLAWGGVSSHRSLTGEYPPYPGHCRVKNTR